MDTKNQKNLNQLLTNWQYGVVYTQSYLSRMGYYPDLIKSYRRNNWIISIGPGAYKLSGDTIDLPGGLAALQQQLQLPIHIGGRTALELAGYAHYARPEHNTCFLFTNPGIHLPKWFWDYPWELDIKFKANNLFPAGLETGFSSYKHKGFSVTISAPERAAMEMLYYVPTFQGFDESLKIISGLMSLRPPIVQELLENCRQVKVKRLFLYMAEKEDVPWFNEIDTTRIDTGKGKRVIVQNGVLDKKYLITIPKESNY